MNQNSQYQATPEQTRKKDEEQLKLLSIFYYVFAGLAFFGVISIVFMMGLFQPFLSFEGMPSGSETPPEMVINFIRILFVIGILLSVVSVILYVLAGKSLGQKKGKTFTMIVAGLACLSFPLGTALGVFTFIVLSRPSVKQLYEENN